MSQLSLDKPSVEHELPTATAQPLPYKIIRPKSGWQALNLAELLQYRNLLFMLALRDIRLRYKQTALGIAWVILQPLVAAGIFSFVFGRVAKLPTDGVPSFVFSYTGLLGWNLFSTTLTKVSASLVGNANLVSKVYFPRLVLPLSTVFSSLLDYSVALGMLAVIMVIGKVTPSFGLLLLPVWMALILLLAVGVGLFAASLAVSYRDIQFILPVATQFLLYGSSVAYAVSAVPEHYRTLYLMNPISPLLEAFRWSLLNCGSLHLAAIGYASIVSAGIFVLGAFAFRRMERRFADVI